ncbi:hypothetical protein [Streptomyces sp. NPDC047123]|uniref:hypothetical protein n=1 Tax=Streptomyces sp. NPDC047123 TaxID=3155622 RepID=UPI0033FF8AED
MRVSQIAAAPLHSKPERTAGAIAPATLTASWLRAKYRPRRASGALSAATVEAMGPPMISPAV